METQDWQEQAKEKAEEYRVKGEELLGKVKELVRQGNVRRIVIKQGDRSVAEFPLTAGVVGVAGVTGVVMVAVLGDRRYADQPYAHQPEGHDQSERVVHRELPETVDVGPGGSATT